MLTTVDKALAALVLGLVSIVDLWHGPFGGLNQDVIAGIIAILTPIVVYFIPNRAPVAAKAWETRK
jgi:hypothetical protein